MKLTTLRLLRFERRLLQIELAKRTGIDWFRLAEIENGDVEARPEELRRITHVLQVPADRLRTLQSRL
jgi:transcriptional regulator with XRE-family HTH domain